MIITKEDIKQIENLINERKDFTYTNKELEINAEYSFNCHMIEIKIVNQPFTEFECESVQEAYNFIREALLELQYYSYITLQ